ncbi:hypothetical protein DFH09DRAFT_1081912 [Mycena vulgaris]|nr:hypothetical protein DFH09DRAFT_1081912 [Mycena vulgaris]
MGISPVPGGISPISTHFSPISTLSRQYLWPRILVPISWIRKIGAPSQHSGRATPQRSAPSQEPTPQQSRPDPPQPPRVRPINPDSLPSAPVAPRAPPTQNANSRTTSSATFSGPVATHRTAEEIWAADLAFERKTNIVQGVFEEALDRLRTACPYCWVLGYNWSHALESCIADVGKDGDTVWNAWHRSAFSFPEGWCWFCLIPQANTQKAPKGGWHYYVPENMRNCKDKNVLKPAIYAFLTKHTPTQKLNISLCPLLPAGTWDDVGLANFRRWAAEPYWGPLLNIHGFLMWLFFERMLVECPDELRVDFPSSPIWDLGNSEDDM